MTKTLLDSFRIPINAIKKKQDIVQHYIHHIKYTKKGTHKMIINAYKKTKKVSCVYILGALSKPPERSSAESLRTGQ